MDPQSVAGVLLTEQVLVTASVICEGADMDWVPSDNMVIL